MCIQHRKEGKDTEILKSRIKKSSQSNIPEIRVIPDDNELSLPSSSLFSDDINFNNNKNYSKIDKKSNIIIKVRKMLKKSYK